MDDSIAIELANKVIDLLELLHLSDQIGHATIAGTQSDMTPPAMLATRLVAKVQGCNLAMV
jgi:hypothetical protein